VGEIGSVIPVVGSYQLLADCRYVSSSIYTLQAWGDLQIPACFITNKSHTPRIGQREYLQLHKKIHHFPPFSTFHGKIYGILWLYPSPHAVPRKATRQVGWDTPAAVHANEAAIIRYEALQGTTLSPSMVEWPGNMEDIPSPLDSFRAY